MPADELSEFLAASIAVWREIDRLDAEPDGYHPVRMSVELRQRERAAWNRYRDQIDATPAAEPRVNQGIKVCFCDLPEDADGRDPDSHAAGCLMVPILIRDRK